jgi:hypothetical protein
MALNSMPGGKSMSDKSASTKTSDASRRDFIKLAGAATPAVLALTVSAFDDAPFALIVHHTDAEREWAYDRASHVGRLDKAWDEASAKGWTVVSMKDDWGTIRFRNGNSWSANHSG